MDNAARILIKLKLICVVLLVFSAGVDAAEVTLYPTDDSCIIADSMGTNFDEYINGMKVSSVIIGSPPHGKAFFRFDLSQLSGSITNYDFRVYINNADNWTNVIWRVGFADTSYSGYGDDWNGGDAGIGDETTLTGSNQPPGLIWEMEIQNFETVLSLPGWFSTTMGTQAHQDAVRNNIIQPAYGGDKILTLIVYASGSTQNAYLTDREGNPGNQPELGPRLILSGPNLKAGGTEIALPKVGWNLFGSGQKLPVLWQSDPVLHPNENGCLISDGVTTKTPAEAVTADWITAAPSSFDALSQQYDAVGAGSDYLEPRQGYWLWTWVDNLTLILPLVEETQSSDKVPLENGWNLINVPVDSHYWQGGWIRSLGITKSITDAENSGWLQATIFGYDNSAGQFLAVPGDGTDVERHKAYWLWSAVPDLELKTSNIPVDVDDTEAVLARANEDFINRTFIHGMWYYTSDSGYAAHFADFAAHNLNYVHYGGGYASISWRNVQSALESNGLYYDIGPSMESLSRHLQPYDDYPTLYANNYGIVNASLDKESPYLVGYYIWDEPARNPGGSDNDFPDLEKLHMNFFDIDPTHARISVIYDPGYNMNNIEEAWDATRPKDVMQLDVYPLFNDKGYGDFRDVWHRSSQLGYGIDMTTWIDDARNYKHPLDDSPIWIVVQAFGATGPTDYRAPTAAELKCMSWISIAHGATGLLYFHWFSGGDPVRPFTGVIDLPDVYQAISELGLELGQIGDEITDLSIVPNIAAISGGGSAYYANGDVQTFIADSYQRTPALSAAAPNLSLYGNAELVGDAAAEGGYAASMLNMDNAWNIQWQWGAIPSLEPGLEYDLYVTIKTRHNSDEFDFPQGDAFRFGVYDTGAGASVIPTTTAPVDITKNMIYQTFKIGTFVPEPDQYAYVAGTANTTGVPAIFVEKFYLVPRGYHYFIAVNRDVLNPENLTISFPAAAVDKYGAGNLSAVNILTGANYTLSGSTTRSFTVNNVPAGEGVVVRIESSPN